MYIFNLVLLILTMQKPTVNIYHDLRRPLVTGLYPVRIRVAHNQLVKFYNTGVKLSTEDFEKQRDCEALRANGKLKIKDFQFFSEINNKIKIQLNKINEIVNSNSYFSFQLLESSDTKTKVENDIFLTFEQQIALKKENGEIGTSNSYKDSLSSFRKFWKYKYLTIEDVDVKFLKKYEKWMLETCGNSITTVGIYLRNLRTVFNIIINHDKTKYENYPFTEKKYIIPTSENEKISLELSDLKKVFEYEGNTETVEKKYLDIWKLIFLLNGINVADLLQLKWSDINGDEFKYNRTKTKRTNRKLKYIKGVINDEAKRILNDWGTNPNLKSEYIFNILEHDDTEVRKKTKIKNFTKCINKSMKKVGVKLGFTEKMTTYVARHSFMSKLFSETGNILVIKEVAGHSSVLTSERYLKTLKSVELKETLKNIANF